MAGSTDVRESQVEDVLVTYPHIARRVLVLDETPQLIARQMILASGRLDMLYATGRTLTLVELKVEDAKSQFISQVQHYVSDLAQLQAEGMLVRAPLDAVLLAPSFPPTVEIACREANIRPITYSPADVLTEFFRSLRPLAELIGLRPTDLGLWNIHLIHRALYALSLVKTTRAIASSIGISEKTVSNHLRLAQELRLVVRVASAFQLTDLGEAYISARNLDMPFNHQSEDQAAVLRGFIVKDPFASPTIFGIYSMVEVVFNLARNGYPVPRDLVISNFKETTGKVFEWSARKTAYHGTRMYSNYAIELGLLGRSGEAFFLTPDGIRFILLLQLHKSLKMIDVVGMGQSAQ